MELTTCPLIYITQIFNRYFFVIDSMLARAVKPNCDGLHDVAKQLLIWLVSQFTLLLLIPTIS